MTFIERLTAATSDEERATLLLEMSLSALTADLQAAVRTAALPHWFDALFLEALLGEESDLLYDQLLALSFIEQIPGRGYAVQERMRHQILANWWRTDPDQFRAQSGRAADYCATQTNTNEATWLAEEIYHRLVSNPTTAVSRLRHLAAQWANYEYHAYEEIEYAIRLANEQIEAGRLVGVGVAWTRLWQAKLSLMYGRADLAAAPLSQIVLEPAYETVLAAELAQTQGDLLARTGDEVGMEAAWRTAYDHYRAMPDEAGLLDAHLVAEKLRQAGYPLPTEAAPVPTEPAPQPNADERQLIENVSTAWIEGVLRTALHQTIDLRMARDGGQPANLLYHHPQRLDQPLVAGHRLSQLWTAAGRALLILGAPGSGKTITLLQLLEELLDEARRDGRAPIPLLFNLSSFAGYASGRAATSPDLRGWLAEEAYNQYRLKRSTALEQLAAQRYVLLLDGLDEVAPAQRELCVAAINEFMATAPCGVVVCSRLGDYHALATALELPHALVLQPLGNPQIEAFMAQVASPARAAMVARLAEDWQLREAVRSPLLLNLYPQAFPALPPPTNAHGTVEERRQMLLGAYVTHVFTQPPATGREQVADTPQTIGWLSFLGRYMQKAGQSLFFVEELQPTWLPPKDNRRYRVLYGAFNGLSGGLFVGLSTGLVFGLSGGLIFGLRFGLISGIAGGVSIGLTNSLQSPQLRAILSSLIIGLIIELSGKLIFELIFGLIYWLGIIASMSLASFVDTIQLREQVHIIRPTWARTVSFFKSGLIVGLIVWLIVWLIGGLIGGPIEWQIFGLIGLIFGLIFGLFGSILSILATPPVNQRAYAGSGVHTSLRNALLMVGVASFLLGLPTLLIYPGLSVFVLSPILPPIFAWFGGLAWCQHMALRLVLARRGWLPWRLVPWLDNMVAHGILRRVGGGYIFIHRSLLEYFAALGPE